MVVRSHQVVDQGFRLMHAGRCITVFSARNYTGRDTNDDAMLLVAEDADGNLRLRPKQLVSFTRILRGDLFVLKPSLTTTW